MIEHAEIAKTCAIFSMLCVQKRWVVETWGLLSRITPADSPPNNFAFASVKLRYPLQLDPGLKLCDSRLMVAAT